jgi:hypothetical protein
VPEALKTPTSSMKRLKISPEKGSVSPSKPGSDYFSSVRTDSEEEEGEVNSERSGESSLMFFLFAVQQSAYCGPWAIATDR